MCDRSVRSTGDLNPYFCNPLSNLVNETAEAARREARERIKRELELHYVFFIEMPWRWTTRKMRSISEDMADEYAEANAEAYEALYDLVLNTLRAYNSHPVVLLDRT